MEACHNVQCQRGLVLVEQAWVLVLVVSEEAVGLVPEMVLVALRHSPWGMTAVT